MELAQLTYPLEYILFLHTVNSEVENIFSLISFDKSERRNNGDSCKTP